MDDDLILLKKTNFASFSLKKRLLASNSATKSWEMFWLARLFSYRDIGNWWAIRSALSRFSEQLLRMLAVTPDGFFQFSRGHVLRRFVVVDHPYISCQGKTAKKCSTLLKVPITAITLTFYTFKTSAPDVCRTTASR